MLLFQNIENITFRGEFRFKERGVEGSAWRPLKPPERREYSLTIRPELTNASASVSAIFVSRRDGLNRHQSQNINGNETGTGLPLNFWKLPIFNSPNGAICHRRILKSRRVDVDLGDRARSTNGNLNLHLTLRQLAFFGQLLA